MKPTIVFETAQLTRNESGPDLIELVGTDGNGNQRKFDVVVARGGGDAYLFDLGLSEFTLYRMTSFRLKTQRNGVIGRLVMRMHRHYASFDESGTTIEGGPHPIGERPVIEEPEIDEPALEGSN